MKFYNTQKITLGQMIVLQIPQELIADPHLSVPSWDDLKNTYGYCRDKKRASEDPNAPPQRPYRSYDEKTCLLPYEEHLQRLNLKPEDPWLIGGVRNLGNNLRIIGYDAQRGLLELNGEKATQSGREYCCLCKTPKRLAIHRVQFPDGQPTSDEISEDLLWAVSGQELVWDGKPAPIEKIIPYTYDLRHVWHIEGESLVGMGTHAYAGEHIEEMIDRFVELAETQPDAVVAHKLKELAEKRGYERECHYLHSAIGISADGNTVIIVQRHGAFEDVAQTIVQAGAYRAIELDQGGSCSMMMGGTKEFSPGRTLLASHYFRPRGLGLLVFKLKELNKQVFTENSDLL